MTTELSQAIERTVTLAQNGDRDDARQLLTHLWERAQDEGDAYDRTVLCHYLADLQDDAHLELTWDLRALDAAQGLTDEILLEHQPNLTASSFLPSLHLNLAADYERLGDEEAARRHVREAHLLSGALPNTELGTTSRQAIARLAEALGVDLRDTLPQDPRDTLESEGERARSPSNDPTASRDTSSNE